MLLAASAKVDVPDRDGRTALMRAAARGDAATVRVLLEAGARKDLHDTAFGKTALMYAAENNHPAVVEALVKAGADIQTTDQKGRTAMDYTAMQMRSEEVKALLESKPAAENP
jgi:ankyrin repeat protein